MQKSKCKGKTPKTLPVRVKRHTKPTTTVSIANDARPVYFDGPWEVPAHKQAEVAWELHQLAIERQTTAQALVGEAVDDLLKKYNKPEILRCCA